MRRRAERRALYLGKNTVVLIGVRDELYVLASDLTVVRARGPACIGRGRHAAYPVMEALERAGIAPARKRIEMTLDIVARHVPVVEPPFRFLALPAERDDGPLSEVPTTRSEQFAASPAG